MKVEKTQPPAEVPPNSSTTTSLKPKWLSDTSKNIISFIFENGGARMKEVADFINRDLNYVKQYLYRLQKHGLIDKIHRTWFLTREGVEFLELLYKEERIRKYHKKSDVTISKKSKYGVTNCYPLNNKINEEDEIKKKTDDMLYILKNIKQISLSNEEEVVVRKLLVNSLKSNNKYLLFRSEIKRDRWGSLCGGTIEPINVMAEFFGLDLFSFQKAVTDLINKGIIYFIEIKGSMGKIGKIGIKKSLYDYLVDKQFELSVIGR